MGNKHYGGFVGFSLGSGIKRTLPAIFYWEGALDKVYAHVSVE